MCLAVPGRIQSLEPERFDAPLTRRGVVDFGGAQRVVSLAFVPEAQVGDHVLVHAGVAIQRLQAEAAEQTLTWLHEVGLRDEADS